MKKKKIICSACAKEVPKRKVLPGCPECGDLYYDKPDLERRLFHIQDRFLEDKENQKAWEDLYKAIDEYLRPITVNLLKSHRCYIPKEDFDDKIHEMTNNFIEKYRKVNKGKVENNFRFVIYVLDFNYLLHYLLP